MIVTGYENHADRVQGKKANLSTEQNITEGKVILHHNREPVGLPEIKYDFQEGLIIKQMREMLDQEWIDLIWEAKELGLSIEEVKRFLAKNGKHIEVDMLGVASWDKRSSV